MKEDMKALIAETFTQLLEKEDIDKITVTKLIGECHISRQTFYYHFQDIMDVLEWTFRRSTQELAQKSLEEENDIDALRVFASFIKKEQAEAGEADLFQEMDTDRGNAGGIRDYISCRDGAQQGAGY